MSKGKVIILSGPSGVGKNTLLEMLVVKLKNAVKISTATTRPPRGGEVDGVDHYFLSKAEFEQKLKAGEVLEHNFYNGNYYGTLKEPLEAAISSGKIGVMEIDVNGAMAIKKIMPQVTTIFINAESLGVIEGRLRERGTDSKEDVKTRLAIAEKEIAASSQYDYTVINPTGHPEQAVAEIKKILFNS
jgi:guanylate kinase